MEKTEIKVKIDKDLYDKAKKYGLNIDAILNTELRREVDYISNRIDLNEYTRKQNIIEIIRRISKESKFKYASIDSIIAEVETQLETRFIKAEDVKKIIHELIQDRLICEPTKSNYRVTKMSQ